MPTVANTMQIMIEPRVVLHDVPWEIYEGLMTAHTDHSAPRFTYDQGQLEIYMPSQKHEKINRRFEVLVSIIAEELELDIESFGSTTYQQKHLKQGVEPDCCFYIQSVDKIAGVEKLDLAIHPPPDLVIEVDVTSPSIDKFPLYAALKVPEIWLCEKEVKIFLLGKKAYSPAKRSAAFPLVTASALTGFLLASQTEKRSLWLKNVREWIRAHS